MQIFQIQGLFAPFVAFLAGAALLLLWNFNKNIRYLRYFAVSLFVFSCGFVLSQVVYAKMTIPNAFASSISYYTVGGLMVHGALMRLGGRLNLPVHFSLMFLDIAGRVLMLQFGLSATVYLIFANAMMGLPMAIGAYLLFNHEQRDRQSILLGIAYATVAMMAIIAPSIILSIGDTVTDENYFSSYYWILLSFLTVVGISILIASFGFTIGSDLLAGVEEKASKDFLSGLLTRRAFDKAANEVMEAYCDSQNPIALLMCDIDHFKKINDQYGHHTGDVVITDFGDLIMRAIPETAYAGRTGGEEFAIIIPSCDIRTIRLFAEGLRTAVSMLSFEDIPKEKPITASFGVTVLRPNEKLTHAMKRADEALYEAKNAGRNQVVASNLNASEYSALPQALSV